MRCQMKTLNKISIHSKTPFQLLMKLTKNLAIAVFILMAAATQNTLQAQFLAATPSPAMNIKRELSLFYTDSENKVLYIDFERLVGNVQTITLLNQKGEVIFQDTQTQRLAVNTIYEIDYSTYPKGEYVLEVSTYTEKMKQSIKLQ